MRRIELRHVWLLFAVIAVFAPASAATQEMQEATLKDLVLQAIKTHEVVQVANSEVRFSDAYGIIELTLYDNGYEWEFHAVPGSPCTDSGAGACH